MPRHRLGEVDTGLLVISLHALRQAVLRHKVQLRNGILLLNLE
jgi:hypothetical protein